MAPRGGFRGRGRGGSFRGRGGRGGSRGRGRGRGGAAYASQGPRFESSRLADKEEDSSEESGSEGPEVENELHTSEEDEVSEDEEDNKVTAQPYMSLIKSLTENASEPSAKRRKLDNGAASNDEPKETEESDSDEAEVKDTDLVEEPEEAPDETRIEDLFEGDEDETPDSSDPFETHFASPDEDSFPNKVKAVQQGAWLSKKIATKTARNVLMLPNTNSQDLATLPAPIIGPAELKLKHRLQETMEKKRAKFDETEQSMASLMFGYRDVLYCKRDVANGNNLRRLACLHAVNHVFKTRDRVIKNNARLSHAQGNEDLELRDQGFTRPKVLMLLPTRESCYRMIEMICSICEPDQQENRKRFDDSYHDKDQRFGTDKPADFRDLFEGNDDDMFRIGVKFTRKTIKYFAQFYNSDILLASPLGLKMAIGSEEGKKVEHDFLSSIEVVIVDQANALLMQNWEHVESIFEHLNLQPKDAHGCDFSRVRNWYLEDQAKYFRQTLLFSEFNTPELSELFRLHCLNWAGKVRVQSEYSGMIQQLGVRAKQTFSRFESPSIDGDPDARFAYFTKAIIPSLVKRSKDSTGTLIFIPSYLDFVRVRNYFASSPAVASLTFGAVSEYSSTPEASRARAHFFAGRHKVLLYTERAHHFRRYQLKGVQRVIMYGLPDNPIFYKEITGEYLSKAEHDLKLAPGQGTVRAMFSKYDILKLERVVGSQRVGKMIHERGDTFDFV